MITQLKFVGIPTHDQDRVLAFYTEKLGFNVATDQPMGAQRCIERPIANSATRVVPFTPAGHESRIGEFCSARWRSSGDPDGGTFVPCSG